MSTFLYTRPTERLTGVVSVNTGVEDSAYPKANLDDSDPSKPAKLTGTTGSFVRDFTIATQVDVACICHHNLDAGLDVKLQANATNAWGAPTLSQAFTIPADYADSFPVNVWLNLKALFPTAGNRTFRYWRLLVNAANSAPVAIGEWLMYSTLRDLGVRNVKWGSERTWKRPAIIQETDLLVKRSYSHGTHVRGVRVDIDPTDTVLTEVDAWYRSAAGAVTPFLIVPHIDETDAWFVTFVNTEQSYTRERRNYNIAQLEFQELSRGLYL